MDEYKEPKEEIERIKKTVKSPLIERLTNKIAGTELFIVIATKNYLEALRNMDGDVITQIGIARELDKPFFIIEDSRLLKEEIEEARRYFSNDNIIRITTINWDDKSSVNSVVSEIKKLAGGKGIDVVTQYQL